MGINIRTKGQTGEREIANALNDIVLEVCASKGYAVPDKPPVQRNQNQSAVGGSDLTNPFGLCIEIKRQEQISVNTWWKQCAQAAHEFGGLPVLIYRQNRKGWRVVMNLYFPWLAGEPAQAVRGEVEYEQFLLWFRTVVLYHVEHFNAVGRERWWEVR